MPRDLPALLVFLSRVLCLAALFVPGTGPPAAAGFTHARCLDCHKPEDQVALGVLEQVSRTSGFLQIGTGSLARVFMADKKTRLINVATPSALAEKIGEPVRVTFNKSNQLVPSASEVSLKPRTTIPQMRHITGRDLLDLVKKGSGRGRYGLIDTRPRQAFEARHIPGAINIETGALRKSSGELPRDLQQPVIFYAESALWPTAWAMASEAESLGYTNTRVYLGGFSDWVGEGRQPVAISPDYLDRLLKEDRFPVLVDIRERELISQGFIPGSVAIRPDHLETMKRQFPDDRNAPIVLYGAGRINNDVVTAYQTILGWGYHEVSVLEDGFAGWKKEGFRIQEGRPNIMIAYVPWEKPGQMGINEFMDITDSVAKDVVLLDVRAKEESGSGTIAYAIAIPLRELPDRLGQIPTGLRVVAFSSDPKASEIASSILHLRGFDATWLAASLSIDSDGFYALQ